MHTYIYIDARVYIDRSIFTYTAHTGSRASLGGRWRVRAKRAFAHSAGGLRVKNTGGGQPFIHLYVTSLSRVNPYTYPSAQSQVKL